MNRIILLIVACVFTTSIVASEITLINNGKPGDSSDARTKSYHDGLTNLGYDVTYENIGKLTQAVDFFSKVDGPVMMAYVNIFASSQNIVHTKENYVITEYMQPLYLCATQTVKSLPNEVTVAYGKSYNPLMIANILQAIGKEATLVPYKNSSAVLEAILGGDVHIAFNNQSKSLKFMKTGKGTCFGHTGEGMVIGVPSLTDQYAIDFELPIMIATVIAKNTDNMQLRKDLTKILAGNDFVEYHTKQQLITNANQGWDEAFVIVHDSEKLWK